MSEHLEAEATEDFEQVVRADGRYAIQAYVFLYRGLEFAAHLVHGDRAEGQARHIGGQQLCEGLRRLALAHWGSLAGEVLERWNIRRTRDFGEMVYFLIAHQRMSKQDADRVEDFDDVYDFAEAFNRYDIPLDAIDG